VAHSDSRRRRDAAARRGSRWRVIGYLLLAAACLGTGIAIFMLIIGLLVWTGLLTGP